MNVNVEEATIHTLTVEVATMKINGRQVTLSVFRQLRKEDLLAYPEEGESCVFRGLPWGTVHYFPDECKDANRGTHLHVVWQLGGVLRRACIDEWSRALHSSDHLVHLDESLFIQKLTREDAWHAWLAAVIHSGVEPVKSQDGQLVFRGRSYQWPSYQDAPELHQLLQLAFDKRFEAASLLRLAEAACLPEERDIRRIGAVLEARYNQALAAEVALRQKLAFLKAAYERLYAQLCGLPQLFIAT